MRDAPTIRAGKATDGTRCAGPSESTTAAGWYCNRPGPSPARTSPVGCGWQPNSGATYWLLGAAEDGFGPELDSLVAAAQCPVILGPPDEEMGFVVDDAYRACDVVALPSLWEGFGNPTIESALHRRPLVIGPYPVAREIAAFGFDWFALAETGRLDTWLDAPDPTLLDSNLAVAGAHFSLRHLPEKIESILPDR